VTETIDTAATAPKTGPKKKSGGLNTMLLADLKSMAGGLGISGAGSMKKAQLVDAIKAAQSGGRAEKPARDDKPSREDTPPRDDKPAREDRLARERPAREEKPRDEQRDERGGAQDQDGDRGGRAQQQNKQGNRESTQNKQAHTKQQGRSDQSDKQGRADQHDQPDQGEGDQGQGEGEGGRRNRRRRGRDRAAPRPGVAGGQRNEPDTTILEDDVLVPAAGILDVLDNYAFVRTSGYLPGVDDVYLSLSMVRKYGLRRGDAVVGQVRQPREGERKEKFNPMVRIDSVNGMDPESGRNRVDFATMTPLYPAERLRLETDPSNLIGRVIDLAAPIGKGQRGLIVSPPKAGKTTILQSIANSISTNNPECHLMVVLIDERPEEVTDFESTVKGEVIASTFDRPPADHTIVAELAIERAKRLVELGHDVVVLLDGLTRLGRAYNLAAPPSGRQLAGSVDSAALHPPKRFFGAARNLESGGSLTIIATALVETGSVTDEVIFEEFQSAANMELRLRSDLAEDRLYPAVDPAASDTRREELLMGDEELQILWKLRRVLSGLEPKQALELLVQRLKRSSTNIEFLRQVQQKTPAPDDADS
jgi:transcription termination factor Rho